jgi:hypothetical protein
MNTAFLRPWNLMVIALISVVSMFLMSQAKSALDNGSSANS